MDNFGATVAFQELKKNEKSFASSLIERVIKKESGVFLWLTLVVASLTNGMAEGDRMSDIEDRMDALPEDLDRLFQRILESVDPRLRENTSQLPQLVRASNTPLSLLLLYFADEIDFEEAMLHTVQSLDSAKELSIAKRLKRRLNSRTRGLLEASGNMQGAYMKVGYLHRTVKDFVEALRTWNELLSQCEAPFDAKFELSKSYLLQLKTTPELTSGVFWENTIRCIEYATQSKAATHIRVRLLDQLDSTAAEVFENMFENGKQQIDTLNYHAQYEPVHWSNLRVPQLERWQSIISGSLLHLALLLELDWYVDYKVRNLPGRQLQEFCPPVPPLLSYIVGIRGSEVLCQPWPSTRRFVPSPIIVKMLLESGQDPRRKYEGSSLWGEVSKEVRRQKGKRGADYAQWSKIENTFLEYGISPAITWKNQLSASFKRRGGRIS